LWRAIFCDMGTRMKTTVELPEPLLERAKAIAGRDSTTLRELVEAGLRLVLEEREKKRPRKPLRDARVSGTGLSPEFAGKTFREISEASYEGRGA